MCTVISDVKKLHLFARTLDLEYSFDEQVVIVPRGFELEFLREKIISNFAIIGTCHIESGTPLFYDGMNEYGLCMATLNFPSFAYYSNAKNGFINIASFELIPFILRQCKDCQGALSLLKRINITNDSFSEKLLHTPMHWIIADKTSCFVLEPNENGLEIFENPYRVLTNAPGFNFHSQNLCNYMGLNSTNPSNTLDSLVDLKAYSRGLGAFSLPGDFSSSSRFIRAVFCKSHTGIYNDEICRMFNVLNTVFVPYGSVKTDTDMSVFTVYSCVMCADTGNYYFSTYENKRVCCVRLHDVNLNANSLFIYDMNFENEVKYLN